MKNSGHSKDNLFIWAVAIVAIAVLTVIAVFSKGQTPEPITDTGSLKIGDSAPSFSLPSATGSKVALDQYDGKPVLLYFNEGVGCQPCWKQIIDLEKNAGFTFYKIPIVAIAPNNTSDWQPIINSNPMETPILADTDNSVSKSYGALEMKSSMHGGMSPGHTFILLDKNHKVSWIGDYPGMNMLASEIISVIKEKFGDKPS